MTAFVDTNVLIYAVSSDPQDIVKRAMAKAVLRRDDLALSVQVLQEFYTQVTRPSRRGGLDRELAVGYVTSWRRYPVQPMTLDVFDAALEIQRRHGFSYWDSAILAAATALGCREVLTEDMSHGQRVGGITVRNPFLA